MIDRLVLLLRQRLQGVHVPAVAIDSPRIIVRLGAVALLAAAVLYAASFIHPEPVAKVGLVSITHPWARGGARVGQQLPIYATFANAGTSADKLISVTSPLAERAIIKELDRRNGLVAARELDELNLPAQSRQTLRPGQSQITLVGLTTVVGPGDRVPLTMRFEKAGTVEVFATVENMGEPEHPEHFPNADRIDERGSQRR